MTRIAKRNGRPAHELFEGRKLAPVPMQAWRSQHEWDGTLPLRRPGLFEHLQRALGRR